MISVKRSLSSLLSVLIAATTMSAFPASAAGDLIYSGFESGADGWTARGTATVAQTTGSAASGTGMLSVTDRAETWSGAGYALDTSVIQPGKTYSFSASVLQKETVEAVHFKFSLEYSTGSDGGFPFGGGQKTYVSIAEDDVASGMWKTLSNPSYTIPADAQNPVMYLETEGSKVSFMIDEVHVAAEGSTPQPPDGRFRPGDVNHSGTLDVKDAKALRDYLLGKETEVYLDTADLDNSNSLNVRDLTLLKRMLLNPAAEETTAPPVQTEPHYEQTTQPSEQPSGTHADPVEYMAALRKEMTQQVPASANGQDEGTTTHITYRSQKANRDKGAYVWTPPGYDSSKKYPVMFMNHGVFGDENGMLKGFNVREMASAMSKSGEAVPFIIVFTSMYTDPASASPAGITQASMDRYDDFYYDLKDSLYPYVCEHYSVAKGRENTAIAGFSMGGRESLYIGICGKDFIGYVCASSPAPGIVPGKDGWLDHAGSYIPGTNRRMTNADFKFEKNELPYLLMIGGGTNDTVVGTFPKTYHEIFAANGTDHIWMEVPGGSHDGSVGIPLFYNFFRKVFKA